MPPPTESIAERLMPAIGALRRRLRRLAGPLFDGTVSASQREVLLAVARLPGRPVTDIAHELALAPNSVSTMVTQLVTAGLLTRETDLHDRRVGRLSLTPDALAETTAVRRRRHGLLQEALEKLTPEQIGSLSRGIDALTALADELDELELQEARS